MIPMVAQSDISPLKKPVKLCFLIRKLDVGGAERQLVALVRALPKDEFEVTIVEFYDGGDMQQEISMIPGVKRIVLGKS